jgi:cytochrome b561
MKYPKSMRVFHWAMALLIIAMLPLGLFMEDFPTAIKSDAYGLHKSIGVVLLILIVFRILNRLNHQVKSQVPAMDNALSKNDKIFAKLGHFVFYILIIIMPLSGYLMSNAAGYPVKLFGIVMPTLIEKSTELQDLFANTHEYIGYAIMAVLALHILAVIKHKIKDKVNLLQRIW